MKISTKFEVDTTTMA